MRTPRNHAAIPLDGEYSPPAFEPFRAENAVELSPAALFTLDGKVAMVTGAAGGIGQWLAAGLGATGSKVVLTDVDPLRLDPIAVQFSLAGIDHHVVIADLTAAGAPRDLVTRTVDRFGRLDILVNAAAINRRLPIVEMDSTTFDLVLAVDLKAPYFLAREAAAAMRQQGGGSIIHIGSANINVGLEDVSVYGMAKAALSQVTKVMAVEWSRYGIRTNCLAPGFMMTPLSRPIWDDPQRVRWLRDRIPMRRPGLPHELVGMCLLLASDAGSYINGQTFFVDGGFFAGSPWNAPDAMRTPGYTGTAQSAGTRP